MDEKNTVINIFNVPEMLETVKKTLGLTDIEASRKVEEALQELMEDSSIHISESTYRNWKSGRTFPQKKYRAALEHYFNKSLTLTA